MLKNIILLYTKICLQSINSPIRNKIPSILILIFLTTTKTSWAQKEGNNWYFGINAGITFNYGKPVALTNGKMNALEGCATMSTSDGRVLFYTDGMSVWDSTHNKTPNGNNTLLGSYNSSQAAIIIPRPDSAGRYFIFTTDLQGGSNGLCYSEFNMSLNSGKGDVVSSTQNKQLLTSTCEKITAVKHANGRDYWIMALHYGKDTIYSYLITSKGLSKTVKMNTGLKLVYPWIGQTLGYMKASPDGSKLAYVSNSKDTLILADFNTSTGMVSNIWRTFIKNGYGLEFSPKGNYLYVAENLNFLIYQFNARAKSQADFISSKKFIDSTKGTNSLLSGALQLGPDGKIYTNWAYHYYLGVIHAPDSAGKSCRAQQNYIHLNGRRTLYGLPNFITTYFDRNQLIKYKRNCLNDSTHFWPSVTKELDSVKWYFGDTTSGNFNLGKSINKSFHIYKKEGKYTIKLISYFKTYVDTSFIDLEIKNDNLFIGRDTLLCSPFSFKLSAQKNYQNYRWSNGDTTKSTIANAAGIYVLTVRDSLTCRISDTIVITSSQLKADFKLSDSTLCLKNNVFELGNSSKLINDSLMMVKWKISDNTEFNGLNIKKSFTYPGDYMVKLIAGSKNACTDSVSKKLTVFPNTTIGFTINKDNQCFNNHEFSFIDTSKIRSGKIKSYLWQLGDGNSDTSKSVVSKKYVKDTTYLITLITNSENGCTDTLSKLITIYPNPSANFSINKSIQCFKNNTFDYHNLSQIKTGSIIKHLWNLGDANSANTLNISQKNYSTADSFEIKLISISDFGCSDSLSKWIVINPNTTIDFTINKSKQCFKGHDFAFYNQSKVIYGTFNNRWQLGDGDTSNAISVASKKYSKDSSYKIQLITLTDKGCADTLVKSINVVPNPNANFIINDNEQCFKWNTFDFTNTSVVKNGNLLQNEWNLGDGEMRFSKDVMAKRYSKSDSFKVELTVVSADGCIDSVHHWVKILEMDPHADFKVFVDSTTCPIYSFHSEVISNTSLLWNLGDLEANENENIRVTDNFTYRYSKFGNYNPCLYIEYSSGCRDTICKELKVNLSTSITIPNVFTPGNDDNLNDAFDIVCKGVEDYHLVIFNRWGQKIFESKSDGVRNDGNNWTGKDQSVGNLYPDGTYFYILNYRYKCEEDVKVANGILTLIGVK